MVNKKISTEEYFEIQKENLRKSLSREILHLKDVIELKKEKIEFLKRNDVSLDDYVSEFHGRTKKSDKLKKH